MKLTEIELFSAVKLVINNDETLRLRLMQSGLHDGDIAEVIRRAPFGGPLLVKVNGREIAISHEIAERIFAEIQCELR